MAYHHLCSPASVEPAGAKESYVARCCKNGQVLRHSSQQSQHLPQNRKLSPASLLPEPDLAVLIHDCAEIIDEVYSSRVDLQGHPLEQADWTLYADRSNYMDKGNRKAGYAVVILKRVVQAKALPLEISAQKAELIALMRTLELLHEKRVNVYIDSR